MADAATSRTNTTVVARRVLWITLAAGAFAVRASMFGPFITPSLRTLFGITVGDTFSSSADHHIALEDPLLLLAGIICLMMAILVRTRS